MIKFTVNICLNKIVFVNFLWSFTIEGLALSKQLMVALFFNVECLRQHSRFSSSCLT